MTLSILLAPSARLPPPRRISEQTIDVLSSHVEYLHAIYNPPIRGARRVDRKAVPNGPNTSNTDMIEELRMDEFERSYTVRWLTHLVSHVAGEFAVSGDSEGDTSPSYQLHEDKLDVLIRSATELITLCAGTAAARTITRRFCFPCPMLGADVEVQLTDVPISVDDEVPTVGTQTWGSAPLLAEMLAEDPERFGLSEDALRGKEHVRILELGAGTGLVSLALAKLLSSEPYAGTKITIVASDYHPLVLENLRRNIMANFPNGTPPHVSLEVLALDWSVYVDAPPLFLDLPFDIIFGADVIYEPAHAQWIYACASALLRRCSEDGGCTSDHRPAFHLVMPLRPTHAYESGAVEKLYTSLHHVEAASDADLVTPQSRLCLVDKEMAICATEDPHAQKEVQYVHYTVRWN